VRKCPSCGHEFEAPKKEGMVCSACPMKEGCTSPTCPRCGYVLPPESKIVNIIRRIFGGDRGE